MDHSETAVASTAGLVLDDEPGVVPTPSLSLLKGLELNRILEVLESTGGSQRRAAEILGLLPSTLHEKLKRFGALDEVKRIRKGTTSRPSLAPAGDVFRYRSRLGPGGRVEIVGLCESLEVALGPGADVDVLVSGPANAPIARDVDVRVERSEAGVVLSMTPKNPLSPRAAAPQLAVTVHLPRGVRLLVRAPGAVAVHPSSGYPPAVSPSRRRRGALS
jgi:hypothetical protein